MAVFISATTNAFQEVFDSTRQQGRPAGQFQGVRRPLRGIEIKENTYSILKVLTFTGEEIPLFDSSATQTDTGIGMSTSYSNFIIQNVTEQRVEKSQIVETFGEDFIFFFGERPRFITVTGILLNTNDFNWKSEFWTNYDQHFRGTKLVEQNARLYMFYDDVVVEGYMMQAQAVEGAETPYHLPFQFQMFVTNYAILSNVGSVFIPDRSFASTDPSAPLPIQTDAITAQGLPANFGATGGGLHGFMAQQAGFQNSATFSIQNTLNNIKNTFYGRQLVIPRGAAGNIPIAPVGNDAKFEPAPRGVPIHRNLDEYPESGGLSPQYDQRELQRVNEVLKLQSPMALEAQARQLLGRYGISMDRLSANYLLLGRAAFAGAQAFGSFGIRQAGGVLNRVPTSF